MNAAAERERERERLKKAKREKRSTGVKEALVWLVLDATQKRMPVCSETEKERERERDSVWPLDRNGAGCVDTAFYFTNTTGVEVSPLPACQGRPAVLVETKYMHACMPDSPDYLCTSTGLYLPVRLTALLSVSVRARQCLDMCLDVYILIK